MNPIIKGYKKDLPGKILEDVEAAVPKGMSDAKIKKIMEEVLQLPE